MLIDSHQHAFRHGRDDKGLVKDMDEHKIDLAWLLTWEIDPWENPAQTHHALNPLNIRTNSTHAGITLQNLILTRDRYPDRFLLGYSPNPLIGNAATLLEAAHRMYDVRICGEFKSRILIDDPRCLNLFRMAGKLEMPVVLHLDVPYRKNKDGEWIYDDQ